MSSYRRRNQDWQAYGQHRRRVWIRQAQKKQETAEEYHERINRAAELMKKEQKKMMMWIAIGLAVLIGLVLLLEFLARIALLRMIGDGYDDN